jgi:uncharacterized cupin superfamily protein
MSPSEHADRPARVVNEQDLDWIEVKAPHAEAVILRKRLGQAAGARQLGVSLSRIPAGKRGWPYHWHAANEEAIYVVSGEAVLRTPDGRTTLRAGDFVALPAGPDGAHQLRNESGRDFTYLAISTMTPTDITVEPDSGKVGLFGGAAPGGLPEERTIFKFLRSDADVDYWDGE